MEETTVETPKKRRGWPPGKKRGTRQAASVPAPAITFAPEPEAPIHVSLLLKNGATREFGCAEHTVENGFHVFMYPSERDRYRTTRREFAVSEIVEIEITAARQQVQTRLAAPPRAETVSGPFGEERPQLPSRPHVHSVKQNAANILSQLETSNGPIKMDRMPTAMAAVSFGDEAPPGLLTGQAD